jgi:hypothetical protein
MVSNYSITQLRSYPIFLTSRCQLHPLWRTAVCFLCLISQVLSATQLMWYSIMFCIWHMTPLSQVLRHQCFSRRSALLQGIRRTFLLTPWSAEHMFCWYWITQCHNSDDHSADIQPNFLLRLLLKLNTASNRSINWYEHYRKWTTKVLGAKLLHMSLFAKHIKHEMAWDQTWPLWWEVDE